MSSQSWISADTPSIAGSSILKQSPPFPSHSESTGPRGADLSLSELYTSDREDANSDVPRPFSLLPQRRDKHEGGPVFSDSERRLAEEEDAIGLTKGKGSVHETRQDEERLQRDLFVLKKLNASLELYDTALKNAKSCTETVALQLDRTDQLLDQYVSLLQQTEKNSKLIFDEAWQGGTPDINTLSKLRQESQERAKREKEERERREILEKERLLIKEEQERKSREVRERDTTANPSLRSMTGVRPTRGTGRGGSSSRGRATTTTAFKRGVSDIPVRTQTTRTTRRS